MLARVTDATLQIHGGLGLMNDYPIERFWRDARVERIWDGTSEIQRHIISRDLLRPLGGARLSKQIKTCACVCLTTQSVAVIGGGFWGVPLSAQIVKDWPGVIHTVHPKASEVGGIKRWQILPRLVSQLTRPLLV